MHFLRHILIFLLPQVILLISCRGDEVVYPAQYEHITELPQKTLDSFAPDEPIGMYILNEGNMGANKASIDYVDFVTGSYIRSLYSERNPDAVKELGDVGNDLRIYGSKLYAVINCSHKVEVMDARSCRRLGQIDIDNCRYIRFADGKAYVSSYVGPVGIDPNAQLGAVYEVDTASLAVTRKVTVGYQPDELEILGDRLYVVNSGGYRAPDYDCTVSVINLNTFKQVAKVPVTPNLHRLRADASGRLWAASRGDGEKVQPVLCLLTPSPDGVRVLDTMDIPCAEMFIMRDSMYFYTSERDNVTTAEIPRFGLLDITSASLLTKCFINDGSEMEIRTPYGITVNPYNGDIFLADARNYVSSGMLYCYDRNGKKKWSVRTGDVPAHMCFVYR